MTLTPQNLTTSKNEGIFWLDVICSVLYCGIYSPLSDDKHQMVRDSSKKCSGQCGHNSNPVATLLHAAVVFCMQPFNVFYSFITFLCISMFYVCVDLKVT